jgi:anti-sigma regulatory factor (Ser/Thr protein kinase)
MVAVALVSALTAIPASVGAARHFVAELLEGWHAQQEVVDRARLAVSEAVANAVRHAYEGGEGLVELSVEHVDGLVLVCVRDHGAGFHTDLARTTRGTGLGLAIIDKVSDSVQLTSSEDGTQIEMGFRLSR